MRTASNETELGHPPVSRSSVTSGTRRILNLRDGVTPEEPRKRSEARDQEWGTAAIIPEWLTTVGIVKLPVLSNYLGQSRRLERCEPLKAARRGRVSVPAGFKPPYGGSQVLLFSHGDIRNFPFNENGKY